MQMFFNSTCGSFYFLFIIDASILINFLYEVNMDLFALVRRALKPPKSTLGRRRQLVNFILEEQPLLSLIKNIHDQPKTLFTITGMGLHARPEYPESHGFITLSCHLYQEHPAQQRRLSSPSALIPFETRRLLRQHASFSSHSIRRRSAACITCNRQIGVIIRSILINPQI
jgi:hypothetical protein